MLNSSSIYSRLSESTSQIQRHGGQVPLPDPVRQAFCAAFLWITGFLGVDTGDKASVLTGVSRITADYARIIMESGNTDLFNAVLAGDMSLRQAALSVRQGLTLIKTYVASSPVDKINLGRAVGVETLFDEAITPALDPTNNTTVVTPDFTAVVTPITTQTTTSSRTARPPMATDRICTSARLRRP